MHHWSRCSFFSVVVIGTVGLIAGCGGESSNPDAKIAENALGVTDNKTTKSVETTRDLKVVKDTKVIDTKTGETIRETIETTPVKVTKELKENVQVDVNVGETKATSTGDAKAPVK